MLEPCLFNIIFHGKQQQQQKQQTTTRTRTTTALQYYFVFAYFFCQFKFHNYWGNGKCNTDAGRQACGKYPTMCIKLNKNRNYVLCACQENSSESDKWDRRNFTLRHVTKHIGEVACTTGDQNLIKKYFTSSVSLPLPLLWSVMSASLLSLLPMLTL